MDSTGLRRKFKATFRTILGTELAEVEGPIDERPKISVRAMDFEHFKNRYGIDDKYHIIEVLRATPQITDEIQDEWNKRQQPANLAKSRASAMEGSISSDIEWIQRVRIHSSMIMGYFNHVAGSPGWDIEKPRVFFWPLGALSHYYPEMKQHLDILEERWGGATPPEEFGYLKDAPAKKKRSEHEVISLDQKKGENGVESLRNGSASGRKPAAKLNPKRRYRDEFSSKKEADSFKATAGVLDEDDTDNDASWDKNNGDGDIDISDPKLNNLTALKHMRCYIQFMEQIVLPLEQANQRLFHEEWKNRVK